MDYWRKKYLLPAIKENKKIALVGIGDADAYLKMSNLDVWDPFLISNNCTNYRIYDIDERLVQIAESKGINACCCDVTEASLGELFDYIFACDVIEHVGNPIAFMVNLKLSLNMGGKIVITTPNCIYWRNFITDLYNEYEDHNFAFNKKHLVNIANKVGLEVVEVSSFQTTGGLNSFSKRVLQYFHYLMAKLGRGNSLIMVTTKDI